MFQGLLGDLVKQFKQLPGIGEKSAQRLALHIIAERKDLAISLSAVLRAAAESYRNCTVCNILSETDICPICASTMRDKTKLCIVESSKDVFLMENTHEYNGYYFVLGKLLSPLDGVGIEDIHYSRLMQLLASNEFQEIILALNPSAEGENTIHFLAEEMTKSGLQITRLSTGIPFGGDIEYTNPLTLLTAFKRRFTV